MDDKQDIPLWTVTVRWGNEAEFLEVTGHTKALARERAIERLASHYQPGGEIVSIEPYVCSIQFFQLF